MKTLKIKEWELTEKGKQIYPSRGDLYSETTALKGFSKEEVAQLERASHPSSREYYPDWEVKKVKRNYSEVKQ